jgi:iron complex transport system substrate-binding protein
MNLARAVVLAHAVALGACSRGRGAHAAPSDAHRIVSVTPSTTEALFAMGAGDRLVGRSRFCDWPPEAKALPVVGGFIDVDLEAILQLGPDLVVGSPGPASARLAAQLGARGIATWFPEVDSFVDIDAMILGLGSRTRHLADAKGVSDRVDEQTRAVELSVAGEPAPRVLMVLGTGPVVAAGPKDFVDEMTRRARATNVLGAGGPWQTLGLEQIIELDPDVVVDISVADTGGPTVITAQAPGWADVRAVREGHVVSIADGRVLRPGPRVAQGLATLARALHPHAPVPTW